MDPHANEPPSLPRSLGSFVGHIWSALRRTPSRPTEVSRKTTTEVRDGMVLRRTTIEEIEYRDPPDRASPGT